MYNVEKGVLLMNFLGLNLTALLIIFFTVSYISDKNIDSKSERRKTRDIASTASVAEYELRTLNNPQLFSSFYTLLTANKMTLISSQNSKLKVISDIIKNTKEELVIIPTKYELESLYVLIARNYKNNNNKIKISVFVPEKNYDNNIVMRKLKSIGVTVKSIGINEGHGLIISDFKRVIIGARIQKNNSFFGFYINLKDENIDLKNILEKISEESATNYVQSSDYSRPLLQSELKTTRKGHFLLREHRDEEEQVNTLQKRFLAGLIVSRSNLDKVIEKGIINSCKMSREGNRKNVVLNLDNYKIGANLIELLGKIIRGKINCKYTTLNFVFSKSNNIKFRHNYSIYEEIDSYFHNKRGDNGIINLNLVLLDSEINTVKYPLLLGNDVINFFPNLNISLFFKNARDYVDRALRLLTEDKNRYLFEKSADSNYIRINDRGELGDITRKIIKGGFLPSFVYKNEFNKLEGQR